jgi:hypothetical protein
MSRFTFMAAIGLVFACSARAVAAPSDGPDYLRDVRPILADNCFACHGGDEQARQGGLRLDRLDAATQGGDSGTAAIVPEKPDESELLRRLTADDDAERMPPADAKPRLKPEQIELFRKWIAAGAKYEQHWALVPPTKPTPPSANIRGWGANEIDRFVHSRLEQEGLAPSRETDRSTLVRRLSLDLVGIPPSPEELKAFVQDASAEIYERQVDRLLASKHFGEKWARHWLDLARYADSDGYEKDLPRKQYLWRDWVINALNRDLPYNQFIIEQVAGDLLPDATQDNRVATGFLRNGMVNEEGAIIAEQFRLEGLFDRMDCLGKAVLGLTIQCAQCHSHKFDPISHTEYYRLLAFINDDYEAISWVYADEQLQKIASIKQKVHELQEQAKKKHADWEQRFAAWQAAAKRDVEAWTTLEPIDPDWIGGLAHPQALPDHSVLTLGFRPEGGELILYAKTDAKPITALRLDALTHGDLPFGGPGRSIRGTFAVIEVIVESQPLDQPQAPWQRVAMKDAIANFAQPEQALTAPWKRADDDKRVIGPAKYLVDGKDETAWGADRGAGRRNQDLSANLILEKPLSNPAGTHLKITLRFSHGGTDPHGRSNNFLGRFRLSTTSSGDKPLAPLPNFIVQALNTPADKRTAKQNHDLLTFWLETDSAFAESLAAIDKAWSEFPDGETVLNLAARSPEHHRETFLLDRGNWQKPTTKVTPGVPEALHPLPEGAEPNRLTFARWLVDPKSPTTARVAVNRIWQRLFGVGLVETVDDFGVRASAPSHPELLDWLAVDFMEHNWSVKHLLRTIVLSSTYRQDSRVSEKLLQQDPKNRLLARGPRFRVDAEVARDSALAAAGLLNGQVGGPSFFPPVPESMFATSFIPVTFWNTAAPPERYRRSLYVFRRRSMPDPVLASFDAPNGDFSCPRRARSNTPLAALTALNEPMFVDAARALALRMLREAGSNDRERAEYAFRLCTSRTPTSAELDELMKLFESQRQRVADGWISSRAITTGDFEKLPDLPKGVSPSDASAWTVVARVLLNLDETLTKS